MPVLPRLRGKPEEKSLPTLASELLDLVRAYAKQETIEPIKGLGRYLVWGVAGSFAIGVAGVLLALGALRLLQTETSDALDGNWSLVPYVLTFVGLGAAIYLASRRIGRGRTLKGTS